MKEITAYRAIDGKLFDNRDECNTHDLMVNKRKDLEEIRKKINSYLGTATFTYCNELVEFLKFIQTSLHLLGSNLDKFLDNKED